MKKIIIAAAISTLALVACSSESDPAPTVTVTESQGDAYSEYDGSSSSEEVYLIAMRSSGNPIIAGSSDSELLEIGYAVCDILYQGYTVDDIVEYMARELVLSGNDTSTNAKAVGYIIGAADKILCAQSSIL